MKKSDFAELTKNGMTRTLIVVSVTIFVLFTLFSFHCRRPFLSTELPIDIPTWGAYGDFIGGLVGTILAFVSILILCKTLSQQQKENNDNRFNNLFFELVKLYDLHLESLKEVAADDDKSYTMTGREFLEKKKKIFLTEFEPVLQHRWNRKSAIDKYDDDFYAKYRTVFVCFATLYRIYDLIDNSEIDEKDKKEYSKIIRSQLSPQELFFLRYNAESFYGANFRGYINKYNILKHLPSFELMEFKRWSKKLNQSDIDSINRLIFMVKKRIRSFHRNKQDVFSECDVRDKMLKIGRTEDSLYIKISRSKIKSFEGLKKLEAREVKNLIKFFLIEMYIFSSFEMINKSNELKVSNNQDPNEDDYIICKISTKNGSRLILDETEKKLYSST